MALLAATTIAIILTSMLVVVTVMTIVAVTAVQGVDMTVTVMAAVTAIVMATMAETDMVVTARNPDRSRCFPDRSLCRRILSIGAAAGPRAQPQSP